MSSNYVVLADVQKTFLYLLQMCFNVNVERNLYIVKFLFIGSCLTTGLFYSIQRENVKYILENLRGWMSILLLVDFHMFYSPWWSNNIKYMHL